MKRTIRVSIVLPVAFFFLAACIQGHVPTPVPLQVLIVNTTDDMDDGVCDEDHCSLREAIHRANLYDYWIAITFKIGDPGPQSIHVLSPLPQLLNQITIDGTTQPGYSGSPMIELDGSALELGEGLAIYDDGSVVKGLIINRFPGPGILVNGSDITIQGNYIGTDVTGTIAAGNGGDGIHVSRSFSAGDPEQPGGIIGGSTPEKRNIISGNGSCGIELGSPISDPDSDEVPESRTRILGNYIGTDVSGTVALGNNGSGIKIGNLSENTIGGVAAGEGNVISGNKANGIEIRIGLTTNTRNYILGNYLGTNAQGTQALGNGQHGILSEGRFLYVGGTDPGAGNLISGNALSGVYSAYGNSDIRGNRIGTDITGTAALPNGVGLQVAPSDGKIITIGGAEPGSRNIISGNTGEGILVWNYSYHGEVKIFGNIIGANEAGDAALGNGTGIRVQGKNTTIGDELTEVGNLISGNLGSGIVIEQDGIRVYGNVIGAGIPADLALGNGAEGILVQDADANVIRKNVIAFNTGSGVSVLGGGSGNSITENSIADNAGLGIAIDEEDVIPNDNGDGDVGANGRQNYPVLTSAEISGANGIVEGTLHSASQKAYRVDLYASDSCDPSGYGEGKRFLTSVTVMTGDGGYGSFATTFPSDGVDGTDLITATATDGNGSTSGFSECLQIGTELKTAGIKFTPYLDPAGIFWGRCEPEKTRISVEIANPPEEISYVLLFARLMNPKSGEKTDWSEGLSMLSGGKNIFFYDLSAYAMDDFNKFGDGVVQYQFVVYNKAQAVIGRSEVYGDLAFKACGNPVGAASTPTPKNPFVGPE